MRRKKCSRQGRKDPNSHEQCGERPSFSQSRLEREEVRLRPVCLVERHEPILFDLMDKHSLACSGTELVATTVLDHPGGHLLPSDHVEIVHGDNLACTTVADDLILNSITEKVDLGEIVSPVFVEKK